MKFEVVEFRHVAESFKKPLYLKRMTEHWPAEDRRVPFRGDSCDWKIGGGSEKGAANPKTGIGGFTACVDLWLLVIAEH